jgi:murein DD-endopeptidase MepM/ murein hydrolase activator NlpD
MERLFQKALKKLPKESKLSQKVLSPLYGPFLNRDLIKEGSMRARNPLGMVRGLIAVVVLSLSLLPGRASAFSCDLEVQKSVRQGDPFQVHLHMGRPGSQAMGDFMQRPIGFNIRGRTAAAFAATALSTPPGIYTLRVAAFTEDGDSCYAAKSIQVERRPVSFERFHVAKELLFPSPENKKRIRKEGKKMREASDKITSPWLWQGWFLRPVSGSISSPFGARRVVNNVKRYQHKGYDFRAREGTLIKAPANGRVTLTGDFYLPGKTVVLDHGLGLYSFFFHLSQIRVEPGDELKRGTILGEVGSTGRSTAPHLHWGMKLTGIYIDPMKLRELSGSVQN